MAISSHAIMAIMAILSILAIMAWRIMVLNMANIGVYAENSKNVDKQWKRNWKIFIRLKIMAQTKYNPKLGPFSLYFGPENGHSRGSTSNGSSELIFMFSESVEQREWE